MGIWIFVSSPLWSVKLDFFQEVTGYIGSSQVLIDDHVLAIYVEESISQQYIVLVNIDIEFREFFEKGS